METSFAAPVYNADPKAEHWDLTHDFTYWSNCFYAYNNFRAKNRGANAKIGMCRVAVGSCKFRGFGLQDLKSA